MNNCIITAFYPFGNRNVNSSMEAVKKLDLDIRKEYLDVSYNKTPTEVIELLKNNPDLLILTGEAGARKYVSLEMVAINHMHASIPDNDNVFIQNKKICDGKEAYFSNINCYELNDYLKNKGFNTYVSLSAGSFICNLSYYTALKYVSDNNLKTKVLFIHFPIENNEHDSELLKNVISFLL